MSKDGCKRTNLPLSIGREQVIGSMRILFQRDGVCLVVVSDVGIGKTYNVFVLAREHNTPILYVADEYKMLDGVYEQLINELGYDTSEICYLKSVSRIIEELLINDLSKQIRFAQEQNINPKDFTSTFHRVDELIELELKGLFSVNEDDIDFVKELIHKYKFLQPNLKDDLFNLFKLRLDFLDTPQKEIIMQVFGYKTEDIIPIPYFNSILKIANIIASASVSEQERFFSIFEKYSIYNIKEKELLENLQYRSREFEYELIGFGNIYSFISSEDSSNQNRIEEMLNYINYLRKKQLEDIDNKQVILVSKKKFLSPDINPNLFGDRFKVIAYDESGIEDYEEVPLENRKYLKRLKPSNIEELDENKADNYIISKLIGYEKLIKEINEYLKEQTIQDKSNKKLKFLSYLDDNDDKLNILLDNLIDQIKGIILFNSTKEIKEELKAILDAYKNYENSLSRKSKLLEHLYDIFIKCITKYKNHLIKIDKIGLDRKSKIDNPEYVHNNISLRRFNNHKIFLTQFCIYKTLIQDKSILKVPYFQNFEKINKMASTFNIGILDGTFSKPFFDIMQNYVFEKFKHLNNEYQPILNNNFKDYLLDEIHLENKEVVIYQIDKYYSNKNSTTHKTIFGKSHKIWREPAYVNGMKFIFYYLKNRFQRDTFAITHKDRKENFENIVDTLYYKATGLNKFKDFEVLGITGNKHYGNEDYIKKHFIFNQCLPEKLKNKDITQEMITEHFVLSAIYQALGRIRPFDTINNMKSLIIWGQLPKQVYDKFTVITPKRNIHLAMYPFLIDKLQDYGLQDLIRFDCENSKVDELIANYFIQTINNVRIDNGETEIKIPKQFTIRKLEFLQELENFEPSKINKKNKKDKLKSLMFSQLQIVELPQGFRLTPYKYSDILVWYD